MSQLLNPIVFVAHDAPQPPPACPFASPAASCAF